MKYVILCFLFTLPAFISGQSSFVESFAKDSTLTEKCSSFEPDTLIYAPNVYVIWCGIVVMLADKQFFISSEGDSPYLHEINFDSSGVSVKTYPVKLETSVTNFVYCYKKGSRDYWMFNLKEGSVLSRQNGVTIIYLLR